MDDHGFCAFLGSGVYELMPIRVRPLEREKDVPRLKRPGVDGNAFTDARGISRDKATLRCSDEIANR